MKIRLTLSSSCARISTYSHILILIYSLLTFLSITSGQLFKDPLKNPLFNDPMIKPSLPPPTSGSEENPPVAAESTKKASDKESCYISRTCREMPGIPKYTGAIKHPIFDPSLALNLEEKNCFCDELCWIYNDCCRDILQPLPMEEDEANYEDVVSSDSDKALPPEVLTCDYLNLTYIDPIIGEFSLVQQDSSELVHIVDDCPASFNNEHQRNLCLQGRNLTADFFFRLPVNGKQTRILYRNYFCARCNNELDLVYWVAEKDGCTLVENNDTPDNLKSELQTANCPIVLRYPKNMRPRLCRKVTSECAGDWPKDDDVATKCMNYGAEFMHKAIAGGVVTYKNKFCARCNHISDESISCDGSFSKGFKWDKNPPQTMLPYSIILDMNSGSGSLKSNRVGTSGTEAVIHEVTFTERCEGESQIYDPFANICRDVYCSAGFEFKDTGCQPRSSSGTDGGNILNNIVERPELESKCPGGGLIPLGPSEYVMYPNRTAFVPNYQFHYHIHEYSVVGKDIHVCPPFSGISEYNTTRNVTEYRIIYNYNEIQNILSFVGVSISLVCLLLHFIVYMIYPVLRNIPGKCVMCLVVALFFGQLLFLFVPSRTWWSAMCYTSAVSMHYSLLAAFFWMNVMAVDIYRTFSSEVVRSMTGPSTRKRFLCYSLYAWFAPALLITACVLLDFFLEPLDLENPETVEGWSVLGSWAPRYANKLCWINSRIALIVFLGIPFAIILLVNIALFIASVYYISTASKASQPAVKSDSKGLLFLYVKLSFVMGLAWVFGFIASVHNVEVLWYLFIFFNSLQGAFICFSFICTSRVLKMIRGGGSGSSQPKTMTQTTAHKNATNINATNNVTASTVLSKSSQSSPSMGKMFANNRLSKENGNSPKLIKYADQNRVIACKETAM